jgi:antitoxin VapB
LTNYTSTPILAGKFPQDRSIVEGRGMALNIKNPTVESLASEVSELTGESKTEAIRRALEERKQRLAFQVVRENRADELRSFLEREVWSVIRARSAGRRLGHP